MSQMKTTKQSETPKATKTAKAPQASPAKNANDVQQADEGPRTPLDREEPKKLDAPRAPKAKPAASEAKSKQVSALDAAANLLAVSKEPMGCRQMIETLAAKGLWTSPGGKTPHATLYSAILREMNEKGKEARFVKTERGRFAANG